MSELLSQDEINALLSAYELVNTPSDDTASAGRSKEVRLYDFARPDRFSKEHLKSLGILHSNFAASMSMMLTGMCQIPAKVQVIGVDQVTYKEYRASVPSKTLIAEVSAEPLHSDLIFEVNPSIVGLWTDCLCGADPQAAAPPSELTPVDLAIAKRVIMQCLPGYAESWKGLAPIRPEVRRVVDSESYEDTFLPLETVLVCTIEVHMGQSFGMMTICLPSVAVETVLPALSAGRTSRAAGVRHDKALTDKLRKGMENVPLQCRVVLGSTSISLSDAKALEVGDVIKINRRVDEDIQFWVGGKRMFNCRPGSRHNKLAVMITEVLESCDSGEISEKPLSEPEMAQAA